MRCRRTVSHHLEHLHRLLLCSPAGMDALESTDESAAQDYGHVSSESWNIVSSLYDDHTDYLCD